jgi:hypothetical protein
VTSQSEHSTTLAIIFGDAGASTEVLKQRAWASENKMESMNSISWRKFKILSGAILLLLLLIIIIIIIIIQ